MQGGIGFLCVYLPCLGICNPSFSAKKTE
jgi:hypothetical protein